MHINFNFAFSSLCGYDVAKSPMYYSEFNLLYFWLKYESYLNRYTPKEKKNKYNGKILVK